MAGLATGKSVEPLIAEQEVVSSIPGARPILGVLKYLIMFCHCPTNGYRPLHGLDDHVKGRSIISTYVLNTLLSNKVHFFHYFH